MRIAALAFVVLVLGCAPGEHAGEDTAETAPAAEAGARGEADVAYEEPGEAAEPEAGAPEADSTVVMPREPEPVAPEADIEAPTVRNWVLLVFSRPVEEADLEWLEANGFRVDSVMSELRVRGWLERPGGGSAIANDPRIARIQTQMR